MKPKYKFEVQKHPSRPHQWDFNFESFGPVQASFSASTDDFEEVTLTLWLTLSPSLESESGDIVYRTADPSHGEVQRLHAVAVPFVVNGVAYEGSLSLDKSLDRSVHPNQMNHKGWIKDYRGGEPNRFGDYRSGPTDAARPVINEVAFQIADFLDTPENVRAAVERQRIYMVERAERAAREAENRLNQLRKNSSEYLKRM